MIYLTSELLQRSELGKELVQDPAKWLPEKEGEVRTRIGEYAAEAVRTINDFVKAREQDLSFDFKVAFKSRTGVLQVAAEATHIADVIQSRVGGFDFDIDPS